MIRTQIQLEEQDFQRLKRQAALVESEREPESSVMELAGKYRSGLPDLSKNHDAYLEDGW